MAHGMAFVAALCIGMGPSPPLPITFNGRLPIALVRDDYLGMNIDTASVAAGMDFSNPSLRNLVKPLAPLQIRIGGTSSHGLVFTDAPSLPDCGTSVCASECCGNSTFRSEVFLSITCIDSIGDFLLATGAELLFDLAPTRLDPSSNRSAWNSTNSELLLAHLGRAAYASKVTGIEVGNEQPTLTTATQLGKDLILAQSLARRYGLVNARAVGPSNPKRAPPPGWMSDYLAATKGKLDLFAVHQYLGVECKGPDRQQGGWSYVDLQHTLDYGKFVASQVELRNTNMSSSTGVFVEETAAAVVGGCVNASDRFIDGFYWLPTLAVPAEAGAARLNRQDLAGWSFLGRPSNYQLAGPPGWTHDADVTKSTLTPHPSWYVTVLWKQLMGSAALGNVTVNSTSVLQTGGAPNASVQVWCTAQAFLDSPQVHRGRHPPNRSSSAPYGQGARRGGASGGSITMAVVNAASVAQAFNVPALGALTPRVEYVLTASSDAYCRNNSASGGAGRSQVPQLPDELWGDEIYLNGHRMKVSGEGVLPQFPIPGKVQSAAKENASFVFPPWSYGFVVFPNAGVSACA